MKKFRIHDGALAPGSLGCHSPRMWGHIAVLVCAISVACWVPSAQAQSTVLVITESHGADAAPAALAQISQRVEAQLRLRGIALIGLDRARAIAAATPQYDNPETARQALQAHVDTAIEGLAMAESARAAAALEAGRSLVEAELENLARTGEGATLILDLCLLGVRLAQSRGGAEEAEAALRGCRQWTPTATPSPRLHPPEVRDLLARVDRSIGGAHAGTLNVEADTRGCMVRVNGAPIGRTPARSLRLPHGNYAIQVECDTDAPGAIHRVRIGSAPVNLRVDAGLQAAAHSRPCLGLRYPDAPTREERRVAHAQSLARVAGADHALVLRERDEGGHQAVIIPVESGAVRAETSLGAGLDDASLAEALVTLATDARILEGAASSGVSSSGPVPAPDAAPIPLSPGRRIAGFSLFGAGAGAVVGGLVVWASMSSTVDDFVIAAPTDIDFDGRRDAMEGNQTLSMALSLGGGALATAGSVFLAPAGETPWWTWTLGAAGLGAMGAGFGLMATAASCEGGLAPDRDQREACGERARGLALASALIGLGTPLLALPIFSLLSGPTNATEHPDRVSFNWHLDAHRAVFTLRGTL